MYYIDTSAAMKLMVAEPGSAALRRWLRPSADRIFSSDLLRTELVRAVRRSVPQREVLARQFLDSIIVIRLSTEVYERAAQAEPGALRSLDALHLAAAMTSPSELEGIVTYDERLAEGARANGIKVVAPA